MVRIILVAVLLMSVSCITIERPIIIEPQRCECVQDPVKVNDVCTFIWKDSTSLDPCCPDETVTYPCVVCRPIEADITNTFIDLTNETIQTTDEVE